MTEKPIIFQGWGVRAIQNDLKTNTRRLRNLNEINETPDMWQFLGLNPCKDGLVASFRHRIQSLDIRRIKFPYGKVGDKLWVRETWWDLGFWEDGKWWGRVAANVVGPEYVADGKPEGPIADSKRPSLRCRWRKRPSIHMPKWAARIWLEITNVRVERIQEIIHRDMRAEGVEGIPGGPGIQDYNYEKPFINLWNSINEKRGHGWQKNPWVWVISFRRTDNEQ